MKPVALIDTNVWVSALINPNGPPARLTDAWLQGTFDVVIALPILTEIAEILRRPRIKRKYGIREEEIVQYLQLIAARATIVSVTGAMAICRDPDDDLILEAALAGGVRFLITRDDDLKRDLELIQHMQERGIQVASVSQFLTILSTMPHRQTLSLDHLRSALQQFDSIGPGCYPPACRCRGYRAAIRGGD